MGRLVKSEFRKIFTTKLWWALLIPAAVVAFFANLGGAAAVNDIQSRHDSNIPIPVMLITLAFSLNFATIFSLIYAIIGMTGEYRHKTVTTTFLTSSSRGAVVSAKLVAYAVMGAGYGVVVVLFSTIGGLVAGGTFPNGGSFLLVALVGVVSSIIWMLLGVGLGTLLSNQVAALISSLVYVLIVEKIISALLVKWDMTSVPAYLPNASASNMVTTLSLKLFIEDLNGGRNADRAIREIQDAFAQAHSPQWWVSGLVFVAYATVITVVGWLVSKQRDIT